MAFRRLMAPIVFMPFCIFLIASPLPEASAGSEGKKTNSLGMEFVWLAPGSFDMGSPPGEANRDDDERQHRVTLTRGFYMQTTEVTVGQWRRFTRETGHRSEAETDGGAYVWSGKEWEKKAGTYWDSPGFSQADSHPVTCVSWNDVQAFIGWLNGKGEGAYRLPTEAEWEYAARAGSTGRFCFGDSDSGLDPYAWHGGNSGRRTHPAGTRQPNVWGLHDMHGNGWEWCQDLYGDYPSGAVTDPAGPSSGESRVLRGGCWDERARHCRSANREGLEPGARLNYFGFRLVHLPIQ
ncbi:formylglycine-generating enzyme family protein [Desulfosarcina sp.]|uniref:formylglycine-generating enzyme family protein n=1 Tax=Desulfosarcina sp. TaxID=2027861 RepID=UPI003971075E